MMTEWCLFLSVYVVRWKSKVKVKEQKDKRIKIQKGWKLVRKRRKEGGE